MSIYTAFSKYDNNQHFLIRYTKFIESRINRTIDGYTERHHILPKSIFPEFSNLHTNKWNSVALTAREHFIAHYILSKIFTDVIYKSKMLKAFSRMTTASKTTSERSNLKTSRIYQKAKEAASTAMKLRNPMHDQETAKKAAKRSKEFYASEEGIIARRKMSEKRKGVDNITQEGKERLSLRWVGVKRPKTDDHTYKIITRSACAIYHTPFGDFASPNLAAKSPNNVNGLSVHQIRKRCKSVKHDDFNITKLKDDARGQHNVTRNEQDNNSLQFLTAPQ